MLLWLYDHAWHTECLCWHSYMVDTLARLRLQPPATCDACGRAEIATCKSLDRVRDCQGSPAKPNQNSMRYILQAILASLSAHIIWIS